MKTYISNEQITWRSPKKSGLTPRTTKAKIIRYAIIKSLQWLSELTHSSSEASTNILYRIQLQLNISNEPNSLFTSIS